MPRKPRLPGDALVDNPSDTRQVREGRSREKLRMRQEADDVRAVMSTREGRRVVWRVLSHTGPYRSVYPAHSDNPHRLAYNAGVQDVGHWLMATVLEAAPEQYAEMQVENTPKASK